MKDKTYYKKRMFLNRSVGIALIDAEVSVSSWAVQKSVRRCYDTTAFIQIGDCTRTITLDFSGRKRRNLKDALYKLDKLKKVLADTRKSLIKMHRDLDKAK